MANTAPFEIIAAPFSLYWAPVGETFPIIEVAPAGNWVLVGTSGDRNYRDAGVIVAHGQTIETFTPLGSTGPRKSYRTAEELRISLELVDITLEYYRLALNNNAVTDVAAGGGAAGYRRVDIYRNLDVVRMALLLRGSVSPYGASWNSQYQVPVAVQMGSPAPVFRKGEPAGLALEFLALEDPNAATAAERFGRIIIQDAAIV